MIDRAVIESIRQENLAKRKHAQRARRAGKPITPAEAARRAKLEKQRADAEQLATKFKLLCKEHGFPVPSREHQFHETRKWRFDFAFIAERVAVECEGGVWSKGRHTRGSGYLQDLEKYNAASIAGWTLIRVTPKQLCQDETLTMLKACLKPDLSPHDNAADRPERRDRPRSQTGE